MDSEDTLAFSALTGVRPRTEVYPLERAAEAYERLMSNKARFRVVLARPSRIATMIRLLPAAGSASSERPRGGRMCTQQLRNQFLHAIFALPLANEIGSIHAHNFVAHPLQCVQRLAHGRHAPWLSVAGLVWSWPRVSVSDHGDVPRAPEIAELIGTRSA